MKSKIQDINNLNLTFDPDFVSTPPVYTLAEMIKICEPILPYLNKERLENPPKLIEQEPFRL